jgi:type VI secretion system protein ImpH
MLGSRRIQARLAEVAGVELSQQALQVLRVLPEGERFAVAAEAIESFKPSYLEWDLCVEIAEDEAPALRLGDNARLGWSSWTKRVVADKKPVRRRRGKTYLVSGPVRADAHLRKTSAIGRKPAA